MRRTGIALLLAASVLLLARLCTGIVYGADEPLAALVLRAPGWAVERTETETRPMAREVVLDSEEPDLVYGRPYRALMHAVPAVVAIMAVAGVLLLAGARRRT